MINHAIMGLSLLFLSTLAHAQNGPLLGTDDEFTESARLLSADKPLQQKLTLSAQAILSKKPCLEATEAKCLLLTRATLLEEVGFLGAFHVAYPNIDLHVDSERVRLLDASSLSKSKDALTESHRLRRPSRQAIETTKLCNAKFQGGFDEWLSCMDQPLAERFIFMGLSRFRWAQLHRHFDQFDPRYRHHYTR